MIFPRFSHLQVPNRRIHAHTVMEMLVASSIATILMGAVMVLWNFSGTSLTAMGNYADLDRTSRNALDHMSRDIRQTHGLTSYSPTSITFSDWDSNAMTYVYNASAQTLTKQKQGTNTVLLINCDYLNFDISQRNPSNNFTFYPTTNLSEAKLIDVSWHCYRTILGSKLNTESVQTAKVVIRN